MSKRQPTARVHRVGVFGGTFNPIHLAHLRSAEEVREAHGLDRILFVPSATPPHKPPAGLASAEHRLAMVRLAVAGNPAFRVSTIEIERGGRSFSVDTLRQLRTSLRGARFAFILGFDAFREIGTWKEYASLFELCDLIVTSRPCPTTDNLETALPVAVRADFCYRRRSRTLEHRTGHQIIFQQLTNLDVSSTALRERVRSGLSIRYLVLPSVYRYIVRHGLYGAHPTLR